jgi:hypothetical protein
VGRVRFSVYGDGVRLRQSGAVDSGDAAVPVRVGVAGRRTIRLVAEPHHYGLDSAVPAHWASR